MIDIIIKTIEYVASGAFFAHTMGFTAATAIFIGAAIYDGDTSILKKGIITVGSYGGFILLANFARLVPVVQNISHVQRYAASVTLIFITIAYITGLILGVYTVKRIRAK